MYSIIAKTYFTESFLTRTASQLRPYRLHCRKAVHLTVKAVLWQGRDVFRVAVLVESNFPGRNRE